MKGESARRNLSNHPPASFQERAKRAQEAADADRRTDWYVAIAITFALAAYIAVAFWLVVR